MQPVVNAEEMKRLDRAAIDGLGLPAIVLMESAGRAVADAALRMLGEDRSGPVAVVCGPGNNGGDGFVAARVLRDRGVDAAVYLAVARAAIKGDAAAHLAIYERAGGEVRWIDDGEDLAAWQAAIADAALVIDAVFGVGLTRPIEGHMAEVIGRMMLAERVLAVDVPSGVATDSGRVLGTAVTAERTVTMAALKIALVSAPGFVRAGAVEVAEIGIPVKQGGVALLEEIDVVRMLPRVTAMDHKGKRGHVLIVGGAPGMRGAGRLAAGAALRAGAGLCTWAAEGELEAPDSVMTRAIERGAAIGALIQGKAAIVIGPGLGQAGAAAARVREVLAAGVPAVLDADALNLLADDATVLAGAKAPVVITPHPGEAGRLLGVSAAVIEDDRLAAARRLADKTGAIVVLKGARTIVCGDDGVCTINPTGGPALGTGGSGDVLAGVIGALLAQKLSANDAARVGVWIHGAAGDRLVARFGDRGVMSSDLADAIAEQIHALSRT